MNESPLSRYYGKRSLERANAELIALRERNSKLEAVVGAARAVAGLPSLRLGKVMGSNLPEHEDLLAALAALDAKPQQGQEGKR